MKNWSRKYTECVSCKQADSRHVTEGLCNRCYQKRYKADPAVSARVDAQKSAWYFRYHKENLTKRRIAREERNFNGVRDIILKRDGMKCTSCNSVHSLVVHHKDKNGRGQKAPNNSLENLTTLCRACHINVHRDDLMAAKQQRKI